MAALIQIASWLSGGYSIYKFWTRPFPAIWWVVVILLVVDSVYTSAAKEADSKGDSRGRTFYSLVLAAIHFSLIGIGIYSLTR